VTKRIPRFDRRFRFENDRLNDRLINLIGKAKIPYAVDKERFLHYRSDDEESFEDILARIRNSVFRSWQVLSSSETWTNRYRAEMDRRGVDYQEEWTNGSVDFLISQEHKPHAWKLG
jgi:hypothetical protein